MENISELNTSELKRKYREAQELSKKIEQEVNKRHEEELVESNRVITEQPIAQFAIKLHNKFCKWNHTDGCSWHYEMVNREHDWSRDEHRRWMNKAINLDMRLKNGVTINSENYFDIVDKLMP